MRVVLLGIAVALTWMATADAAQRVRGHVTRSGTYVAPHYRTKADRTVYNNYSTRPNVNPYTGKIGRVRPDTYRARRR